MKKNVADISHVDIVPFKVAFEQNDCFVIHGAIHMSGDDRHCVLHTHSRYGTAVSMQKHGLLPVSQKALTIMGWIGYHDFEGLDSSVAQSIVPQHTGDITSVLSEEEPERLAGE